MEELTVKAEELVSTFAGSDLDVDASKRTRRTRAWMIVKSVGDNPVAFTKVLASFSSKDIKEIKRLIENCQCVLENMKTGDVKSIVKTLQAVSENCELEIMYEAPEGSTSTPHTDMEGFVTLGGYFKVDKATYNILLSNVKAKRSTMLLGPTGVN